MYFLSRTPLISGMVRSCVRNPESWRTVSSLSRRPRWLPPSSVGAFVIRISISPDDSDHLKWSNEVVEVSVRVFQVSVLKRLTQLTVDSSPSPRPTGQVESYEPRLLQRSPAPKPHPSEYLLKDTRAEGTGRSVSKIEERTMRTRKATYPASRSICSVSRRTRQVVLSGSSRTS